MERPTVQAFAGSLDGHRARKGILISTSSFSADAEDFVDRIDKKPSRRALQVLLELESMRPSLASPTTANPQYPWLVGLTTEVEFPARSFSKSDVKRFISPVHRLLGAVRSKLL